MILAPATDDFEHILRFFIRAAWRQGQRLGIRLDRDNSSLRIDKNHVERDIGVLHPKMQLSRRVEEKQHAAVGLQTLAKHQAALALSVGARQLHRDAERRPRMCVQQHPRRKRRLRPQTDAAEQGNDEGANDEAESRLHGASMIESGGVREQGQLRNPIDGPPLSQRILLLSTRPIVENAAMVARGFSVDAFAPLRIVAQPLSLQPLMAHLSQFELLAFSSAHAVAVFASLRPTGVAWPASTSQLQIACVGLETAAAVRRIGLEPQLVSEGGGQELAAQIIEQVPPCRVLWPRAKDGRPELAVALQAAGFSVAAVDVYASVADPTIIENIVDSHHKAPYSAVAVTSPKNGQVLLQHRDGVALLSHVFVAAIGQTTAAALQAAGIRVALIAKRPDLSTLLDGICEALAARPKIE